MQEGRKEETGRDPKKLRIVYMGTPDFAVPPLRRLVEEGYNVVAVVTSPDRPAGRGLRMQPSAVKQYAEAAGLTVLQPEKLRDAEFVRRFAELRADLGVVIAFRMLPEIIWSAPAMGTFNMHASLLPQYRGAAPINRALMNGETQTGLTTFMLDAEIDKGAILARREVDIRPDDTAGTLHDRLRDLGPDLVEQTIAAIASGRAEPLAQENIDAGELKTAPKIFPQDCLIDFTRPGARIVDQVRGLSPYPCAWSDLEREGGEIAQVKIFSVRFIPHPAPPAPGTILSEGRDDLRVACADGYIAVDDLRPAGKKRMRTEEFLRGVRNISSLKRMAGWN